MQAGADIRPMERGHIEAVLADLRQADRRELLLAGFLPADAVRLSYDHAEAALAGFWDGELACVWGVTPPPVLGDRGLPWLFGTRLLERVPMAFLRRCKPQVQALLERVPQLENWVHADNTLAIAWLGWLGFTLEDPAPYGPYGAPFRHFTMEA